MIEAIKDIIAAGVLIGIAYVLWKYDFGGKWGKIVSVILAGAAIMGLFQNFWTILIVIIIGIVVFGAKK